MFSKFALWRREESKFLANYQILAQPPNVMIIFSLGKTADKCQQLINDGYKHIDHGLPNNISLPQKSCAVTIESMDGSVEVKPSSFLPILYNDLKRQKTIQYKVILIAGRGGDHLLQLCFRSGSNNFHKHPFQVTLEVPRGEESASPDGIQGPKTLGQQQEEKFLVKYQILTKGSIVVVIYSLQDTAHACQKFTATGYKSIESGATSGTDVQLPRFLECTSSIESSDPSVEISPRFKMPLSYTDLKNQTSIQHKVTLLTSSGGRHLLNLCLKRENYPLRSEPFHVTLGADDLHEEIPIVQQDDSYDRTNGTGPFNRTISKRSKHLLRIWSKFYSQTGWENTVLDWQ
ncbi:uncharacterized protein LOC120327847 [Styela clava]